MMSETGERYRATEEPERYAASELDVRYGTYEKPEKYSWREDSSEKRDFIVGESKEVAIEFESTDGTEFNVASADYVYKESDGTVLESGDAEVNGKEAFILLTPSVSGYLQKITFTVTLQPLDDLGQLDPTRNAETVKSTVTVNVSEE
ncbi:MAG: hypothetical protein VR69_08175 [Peptococcaceae bacterium BRH_c4b]|nr:MAG: hypothetical protein VR69_08175 [Peptococcaceae bacterium BRH_c4b]